MPMFCFAEVLNRINSQETGYNFTYPEALFEK
jgi:hypothetical protein